MKPTLTILIPTIPSRAKMLDGLLLRFNSLLNLLDLPLQSVNSIKAGQLRFSIYNFGDVEIITCSDNKENTIGKKRNALVNMASGEYVAHFDDDDEPTEDYFEVVSHIKLYTSLQGQKPDACTLKGLYSENGGVPEIFEHSDKYTQWRTNDPKCEVRYERYINHLNAILTSIARQVKFPELNHGEDHDFSNRLLASGLIKSCAQVPNIIYKYKFISDKK